MFKLIKYTFLMLFGLASSFTSVLAQQSVILPNEVEQDISRIDDIFSDIENISKEYEAEQEQLQKQKEDYQQKSNERNNNRQLKSYYQKKKERVEAKLLLLDYNYYKEVSRTSTEAFRLLEGLQKKVQQEGFGETVVVETLQKVEGKIQEREYRLKNLEVIEKYGRLTNREIERLAQDRQWQRELIEIWMDERVWYSSLLQQVQDVQERFANMPEFIEHLQSKSSDYKKEANRQLANIKTHAKELRAEASQYLFN